MMQLFVSISMNRKKELNFMLQLLMEQNFQVDVFWDILMYFVPGGLK